MTKLKNQKGITMITLSVAILIMLVISSVLIYNTTNGIDNTTLTNMYNDIDVLKEKISIYYVEHGKLPVLDITYPNVEAIAEINENDNGNYYIIDLKLFDGLRLNYGRGYDLIEAESKYNSDIYVVNEQSHNVYYMLGIEYDNSKYYTTPETYTKVELYSYDKPYIPEGFRYEEGAIDTGFVIEQIETGNQFVWIPVPDYDVFVNDADYKLTDYSDSANGYVESEEHYNNMLASVKKYGGFYVGRYEAGITTAKVAAGEPTYAPVEMQNQYPYNFVTRDQAQTMAEKIIVQHRTTSLMYGIQWDAILRFIATNSSATQITVAQGGSASWGNYTGIAFDITNMSKKKYSVDGTTWETVTTNKTADDNWILTTGATTRNQVLNIYDLAGNVAEYTLEKYSTTTNYVYRGGNYSDDGATIPASARQNAVTDTSLANIGFRVAIW